MSIMGMIGFEAQDTDRDKLTVILGAPTYDLAVPADSASERSLQGTGTARYPWSDGAGGTVQPSGNTWWFGFQSKRITNNTNNDKHQLGCAFAGTEGLTLSYVDTTAKYTLRSKGVVVAEAVSAAFSIVSFDRLMVKVTNFVAGVSVTVDVYIDGDIATSILSWTASAGAEVPTNKPDEFWIKFPDTSSFVDDMWAMDPLDATGVVDPTDLISCSIKPQVPTGNGNHNAWTGDFTDIDELPASDSDAISTVVVDDRESWTHAAIAEDRVLAVQIKARVIRNDVTAGTNIEVFMREAATDADQGIQAAPGSGDILELMNTNRSGGAWSASQYDATEFGVAART